MSGQLGRLFATLRGYQKDEPPRGPVTRIGGVYPSRRGVMGPRSNRRYGPFRQLEALGLVHPREQGRAGLEFFSETRTIYG